MNLAKIFLTLFLTIIPSSSAEDAGWPTVEFTHVVAFCYDFSKDSRGTSIVFPDKSLHRGIIKSTTTRLNPKQITALRDILTTDWKGELVDEDCYEPHHAFVFYNSQWQPVAWIDICFLCEGFVSHPKGVREKIDLDALQKLVVEIGLPNYEDSKDYTKLYQQEQPSEEKSAPAPKADSDPFADS